MSGTILLVITDLQSIWFSRNNRRLKNSLKVSVYVHIKLEGDCGEKEKRNYNQKFQLSLYKNDPCRIKIITHAPYFMI